MSARGGDLDAWLAALEDEHGKLSPEAVVAAARDPKSPGHEHFEWDNKKAAHQYRVEQARALLTKRQTFVTESYTIQVPRYVRDPDAPAREQSYVSVRTAAADADLRHRVLVDDFARVSALLQRTRDLAKAFGLLGEVDDLIGKVAELRVRVEHPGQRPN
jgi:hypothetical protein